MHIYDGKVPLSQIKSDKSERHNIEFSNTIVQDQPHLLNKIIP